MDLEESYWGPRSLTMSVSKARKEIQLDPSRYLQRLPPFHIFSLANPSSYRKIGTASRFVRVEHELWSDLLVKLLGCEEAQGDSSFFERSAFLMCLLCCFGNIYEYENESMFDC